MQFLNKENLTTFLNKCKQYFAHTVNDVEPDVDGNIEITNVETANNLISSNDQFQNGEFIYRTTGGEASISSGIAHLQAIYGNSVYQGKTNDTWESSFWSADGQTELETDMTVSIDEDIWKSEVTEGGDRTFIWIKNSKTWDSELGAGDPGYYGITINNFVNDSGLTFSTNEGAAFTVEINKSTFEENSTINQISGTYTFVYIDNTNGWQLGNNNNINLSNFGITINVTGTLQEYDFIRIEYINQITNSFKLIINYTKGALGTLQNVNPISFQSTGFNAFDNTLVYYKGNIDENSKIFRDATSATYICHAQCISGLRDGYIIYDPDESVSQVGFCNVLPEDGTSVVVNNIVQELDNTKTVIKDFEEDGYIIVITTNYENLQIHPRWSGKADEETGNYNLSEIDFSSIGISEWGLAKVNDIFDEVDFTTSTYIKRIERQLKSESLPSYETTYIEDETYRYYVLDSQIETTFTLDSSYEANDYGTEEFIYDDNVFKVPVPCRILYGQNLIDKLRTDVVTISPQELTLQQRSQILQNLQIYPVGSIYMSINNTNPALLFGGTWEQIKGRFLIGAGANDANTTTYWGSMSASAYNMPAGEMGGEAAHKLIESELPKLSGYVNSRTYLSTDNTSHGIVKLSWGSGNSFATASGGGTCRMTVEFGGDGAHNNMPPYLAVYMWKRTA